MNLPEDDAPHDPAARGIILRRLLFTTIFFLGTVLAAIGWIIEWKGLDEISTKYAQMTILALVGHALQVIAGFGLLLIPDAKEEDENDRIA